MKLFNIAIFSLYLSTCFSAVRIDHTILLTSIVPRMVPNIVDIRSLGMGNTEVAGDLGSNSIFSNPALLSLQNNGNIKLGSSLKFGFYKDEWSDAVEKAYNDSVEINTKYKPMFNITHISAALPIHLKASTVPLSIAFGIGYQKAIDLSESHEQKAFLNTSNRSSITTTKTTGGLCTVSPGAAIGLFDHISAGLSLNIGFSKVKTISNKEDVYSYSELTIEDTSLEPGNCIYPTFSFSLKPLDNMCIGLAIAPQYSWKFQEAEIIEKSTTKSEIKVEDGTFTMPLKFSVGIEYKVL